MFNLLLLAYNIFLGVYLSIKMAYFSDFHVFQTNKTRSFVKGLLGLRGRQARKIVVISKKILDLLYKPGELLKIIFGFIDLDLIFLKNTKLPLVLAKAPHGAKPLQLSHVLPSPPQNPPISLHRPHIR